MDKLLSAKICLRILLPDVLRAEKGYEHRIEFYELINEITWNYTANHSVPKVGSQTDCTNN
jgi:hypothetical protein